MNFKEMAQKVKKLNLQHYATTGRRIDTEESLKLYPDLTNSRPYMAVCTTGFLTSKGQLLPRPNDPRFKNVKRIVSASSVSQVYELMADWKDIISIDQIYTFDNETLEKTPHLPLNPLRHWVGRSHTL